MDRLGSVCCRKQRHDDLVIRVMKEKNWHASKSRYKKPQSDKIR